MPTVVIMAPGWQEKINVRGLPFRNRVAKDIAKDVRENIVESGLIRSTDLLDSVHVVGGNILIGTDHWAPLEFGAMRHEIPPSKGKALYSAERNFGPVRHPVDHPGNRAYAPMRRAAYKRRTLRY